MAIAAAGCRTQPLPPPAPAVVPPPPPAPSTAVSADLLYDRTGAEVKLGPGEEYVPPRITPADLPVYPATLVPLNLPPQIVSVRLLTDEDGKLVDVSPSPLAATEPDGRYAPAFEQSIRWTVGCWKYWPARIRKFRPGPDSDNDGKADYRIMVAELKLKAAFDIAFTFRIVDGRPVVTSDAAK